MTPADHRVFRRRARMPPACVMARHPSRPGPANGSCVATRQYRGARERIDSELAWPPSAGREEHSWSGASGSTLTVLARLAVGSMVLLAALSQALTGYPVGVATVLGAVRPALVMQPVLGAVPLALSLIALLLLLGLAERLAAAVAAALLVLMLGIRLAFLAYWLTHDGSRAGIALAAGMVRQSESLTPIVSDLFWLLLCLSLILDHPSRWSVDGWNALRRLRRAAYTPTASAWSAVRAQTER